MGLEGSRIIIVGAGGGIGSALARRLKRLGAQPVLMGRNAEKLEGLSHELGAPARAVDAANGAEFDAAVSAFAPIQGIVNCAGSVPLKPAHLTSDSDWADTLRTNLTTSFQVVRTGARLMMQTGGRSSCTRPPPPVSAWITENAVALRASLALHGLGRAGKAEHVAPAIGWLLDPENDWITGQVLGVDGGLGSLRSVDR